MLGYILKEIVTEGVKDGVVKADEALWGAKSSFENESVTAKVKTNEFRKVPTGGVKVAEYADDALPSFSPTEELTQQKVVTKKFWYEVMYETSRDRQTGKRTKKELTRTPLYEEILDEEWVVVDL